jgi:cell wall-associated NlpC family hydrolase
VVRRNAQQLHQRAASAAAAAARARQTAVSAVAQQTAQLAAMRQRQQTLTRLLASARQHESRLQRQRLAAIARARARAIARREAARSAPVPEPAPTPLPPTGGSISGTVSAATAAAAVHVAEAQIGKPYVWAAAGPNSFDCSGLTMYAYAQEGVHLDHFTGSQWNEGAHLSRSQLRPGDLVFFAYDTSNPATIHHVGMYIGNGEMVQAPQTGENVQISSYDRPDYIGAVRPYAQ